MASEAVLYCRVSSEKQVQQGHGLDGQESRGKTFVESKGWELSEVFKDEGISGKETERPGLQALLRYLEENAVFGEPIYVVIDDLSRLARDVEAHFTIRARIKSRNGILVCLNQALDDEDPYSKFGETIMAGAAELFRNENRLRVIKNMRSRMEQGYWSFDWPPGMKTQKMPGHGKVLVYVEPKAGIIKEALEGFASNRFVTRTDVQQFLDSKGFYHRKRKDRVHLEQAVRILERAWIYAGFIEYPKWKITRREGKHEALISEATLNLIEKKLNATAPRPQRKGLHEDFELRGYAACSECGELMTASWSKGRNQMYPYYRCTTPKCVRRNKGLRKEFVDNSFKKKLEGMSAKPNALKLLGAVFSDSWKDRLKVFEQQEERQKTEMEKLEEKIVDLVSKIEDTKSAAVVKRYELRIEELETQKRQLRLQSVSPNDPRKDFGTALTRVLKFLQNPSALWNSDDYEDKKTVLRLAFVNVIPFSKENGVGTASFSLLFELSKLAETDKKVMVEMLGKSLNHLEMMIMQWYEHLKNAGLVA